jgi:hypothetical protein
VKLATLLANENHKRAERFRLALDRRRTKIVSAPLIVKSHKQFEVVMLRIKEVLTGTPVADRDRFLCSMYYLLGWCVGDFGKNYASEDRLSARISFQLTKKHSDNLALGDYLTQCVRTLGVECRRYGDRPNTRSNPNGSFLWRSAFSPAIGWATHGSSRYGLG